jgi:hypothetical protein
MRELVAETKGAVTGVTASGTDTYSATLAPAPSALTTGMTIHIKFTNANATTTPTLNIGVGGAVTIVKHGSAALAAGDIPAGHEAVLRYNGTNFVLLNPKVTTFTGGTLTSTTSMSGAAFEETQGSNIAGAATTDIGAAAGNFVQITGTSGTITSLGNAQAGARRIVYFVSAGLVLTHNISTLVLPGQANITVASGDVAVFVSIGTNAWRCVSYTKLDGTPVALATQAQMETGTSNAVVVTPGRQHFHPLSAKGWLSFTLSGGSLSAITTAGAITNVTRNSTGNFTISLSGLSSANYALLVMLPHPTGTGLTAVRTVSKTSTSFQFTMEDSGGTAVESGTQYGNAVLFGDLT